MSSEPDRLAAAARHRLIRLAAFHTAQIIAEDAQLFAAKLREGADDIPASQALMAFSIKVRATGSNNGELLLAVRAEDGEPVGILH